MTEQEKREDVILELETCLTGSCHGFKTGVYCPFANDVWESVRDELAMLKEQEPRVMTPDEVTNAPDKSVIWLELKPTDKSKNEIYPFVGSGKGWYSCYCSANTSPMFTDEDVEQYGAQFRCWTFRPTDKQREEAEWSDQGGGHQNSGPV